MSLTIREKVASLKEKVAGLKRDVVGLEAIVNNLDHLQCRTEGQLRHIIDAALVDEPFYPYRKEDELVSTCVVCYCVVVYSNQRLEVAQSCFVGQSELGKWLSTLHGVNQLSVSSILVEKKMCVFGEL